MQLTAVLVRIPRLRRNFATTGCEIVRYLKSATACSTIARFTSLGRSLGTPRIFLYSIFYSTHSRHFSASHFSATSIRSVTTEHACPMCHTDSIGRLADERVYQADLAARLIHSGLQVDREVEITLSHQSFTKSLFLDCVVNRMAVYELKAAKQLSDAHTELT